MTLARGSSVREVSAHSLLAFVLMMFLAGLALGMCSAPQSTPLIATKPDTVFIPAPLEAIQPGDTSDMLVYEDVARNVACYRYRFSDYIACASLPAFRVKFKPNGGGE